MYYLYVKRRHQLLHLFLPHALMVDAPDGDSLQVEAPRDDDIALPGLSVQLYLYRGLLAAAADIL